MHGRQRLAVGQSIEEFFGIEVRQALQVPPYELDGMLVHSLHGRDANATQPSCIVRVRQLLQLLARHVARAHGQHHLQLLICAQLVHIHPCDQADRSP